MLYFVRWVLIVALVAFLSFACCSCLLMPHAVQRWMSERLRATAQQPLARLNPFRPWAEDFVASSFYVGYLRVVGLVMVAMLWWVLHSLGVRPLRG